MTSILFGETLYLHIVFHKQDASQLKDRFNTTGCARIDSCPCSYFFVWTYTVFCQCTKAPMLKLARARECKCLAPVNKFLCTNHNSEIFWLDSYSCKSQDLRRTRKFCFPGKKHIHRNVNFWTEQWQAGAAKLSLWGAYCSFKTSQISVYIFLKTIGLY